MEREQFKKLFPHLVEEMENGRSKAELSDNFETDNFPRGKKRRWVGYDPDAIDFIRRCETIEQAREVVEYLESKGEITSDRAIEIQKQLDIEGLRSFGAKKEKGFYHKNR